MNHSKSFFVLLLCFFGSFVLAEDRRANLTGQRVYLEKKGDAIYYGADEQSDHDDGVSWMRGYRGKVEEADAKTFHLLNTFCAKDKNYAYYGYNSTFAIILGVDIKVFKPIRENCAYAIMSSGVIIDLISVQPDISDSKNGEPGNWTGERYLYKHFSLQNVSNNVYRAGKDEHYFYFVNHENNTYSYDSGYKVKYDKIKQLFEQKVRGRFDQQIIKSALFAIEDVAENEKDLYTQAIVSALLDDYRPYDWN